MVKTYDLLNLDVGESPLSQSFEVGPYTIRLKRDYKARHRKLSSLETVSQQVAPGPGGSVVPILGSGKRQKARVGEPVVTATAHVEDEPNAALAKTDDEDGIWDLCVVLIPDARLRCTR